MDRRRQGAHGPGDSPDPLRAASCGGGALGLFCPPFENVGFRSSSQGVLSRHSPSLWGLGWVSPYSVLPRVGREATWVCVLDAGQPGSVHTVSQTGGWLHVIRKAIQQPSC